MAKCNQFTPLPFNSSQNSKANRINQSLNPLFQTTTSISNWNKTQQRQRDRTVAYDDT